MVLSENIVVGFIDGVVGRRYLVGAVSFVIFFNINELGILC